MVRLPQRLFLISSIALGLAACGGGGGGSTNDAAPTTPITYPTTLACYRGTANPECNLRIYQIMVESFIDGDASADYNVGYGTSPHKGDLQGIINSLDYIKSTGVNAIWLTPIFQSIAAPNQDIWADRLDATGYFASDYFKIDPKFGTLEQARTLVNEAHARGMYVFFDGVFGHSKTNVVASPNGLKPVFLSGTTVDYSKANTINFYKEVATYWIKELKIDGWRLDQAYQVPTTHWVTLKNAVKTASNATTYTNNLGIDIHPLGYMVAEIWDGASKIASAGYGTNPSPVLSSAFDFPIRYKLTQTLATQEDTTKSWATKQPASALNDGFNTHKLYPAHAMPNLMLGNHDLVRFGDLIQRAGLGNPSDDAYWNRHKAAFTFMAAYSGPITLYYGDEIGQEVANFSTIVTNNCADLGLCDDHVARSSGKTSGLSLRELNLKNYVAVLMGLRDTNPALAIGTRTHLYSDASVYVDRKDAGSNHVVLALNITTSPKVIVIDASKLDNPGDLTDLIDQSIISVNGGSYNISVPALSARLLKF